MPPITMPVKAISPKTNTVSDGLMSTIMPSEKTMMSGSRNTASNTLRMLLSTSCTSVVMRLSRLPFFSSVK